MTLKYRELATKKIEGLLNSRQGAAPVIFVGAGLPLKYLNSPSWPELLRQVLTIIGQSDDLLDFYVQRCNEEPTRTPLIGAADQIAMLVHEWAWSPEGRLHFPDSLYNS